MKTERSLPKYGERLGVWLGIILLTVFSLTYQGGFYGPGVSDHGLYIPFVKFLNQPTLYPQDVFIQSVRQYFTVFWRLIALVARIIPLKTLFIGLHIITRFAFLSSLYYLARRLEISPAAALLGVAFCGVNKVFLNYPSLSDGLVHSEVVWPFLLVGLAFFWREKYLVTAVLMGLAFNIHPLLTAYLLVSCLALVAISLIKKPSREILISLAGAAAVFLLLALPSLLWVKGNVQTPYNYPPQWFELNVARNKHFMNPAAWSLTTYVNAGLLLALFSLGCFTRPPQERSRWLVYAGGGLFLTLLGMSAWGQSVPVLVKAQLSRAFLLLVFPALLFTAAGLVDLWGRYSHAGGRVSLVFAGLLIFLIGHNPTWPSRRAQSFSSWEKLQRWAQANTAPESLFITPPEIEGWQIYSERGTVLDWKGMTSILWAPATADEWLARLKDYGYELQRDQDKDLRISLQENYGRLTPAQLSLIGRKYGATYVISVYPHTLPFTKVYQNSTFQVYLLAP